LLKAGQKSDTLFNSNSYVVSVAGIPNTNYVLSGHYDNSVHIVNYENLSVSKLITHTSIPFCMSAGRHIAISGLDMKVTFYDMQGKLINKSDYSKDNTVKEFSGCQYSPSGDSVVFLNFNKF
jgi:intraflagellar transport protein 172